MLVLTRLVVQENWHILVSVQSIKVPYSVRSR